MVWYSLLSSFISQLATATASLPSARPNIFWFWCWSYFHQSGDTMADSGTQWQIRWLICNKYPWELQLKAEIACTFHSSTQPVKTNSFGFYLVEITTITEQDTGYMISHILQKINNSSFSNQRLQRYNVLIINSWG